MNANRHGCSISKTQRSCSMVLFMVLVVWWYGWGSFCEMCSTLICRSAANELVARSLCVSCQEVDYESGRMTETDATLVRGEDSPAFVGREIFLDQREKVFGQGSDRRCNCWPEHPWNSTAAGTIIGQLDRRHPQAGSEHLDKRSCMCPELFQNLGVLL
jgi:hypothetical protein